MLGGIFRGYATFKMEHRGEPTEFGKNRTLRVFERMPVCYLPSLEGTQSTAASRWATP